MSCRLEGDPAALVTEIHEARRPADQDRLLRPEPVTPASRTAARSADSNGLAASPSASPATRRTARAAGPRRFRRRQQRLGSHETVTQCAVRHGERLGERQRRRAVENGPSGPVRTRSAAPTGRSLRCRTTPEPAAGPWRADRHVHGVRDGQDGRSGGPPPRGARGRRRRARRTRGRREDRGARTGHGRPAGSWPRVSAVRIACWVDSEVNSAQVALPSIARSTSPARSGAGRRPRVARTGGCRAVDPCRTTVHRQSRPPACPQATAADDRRAYRNRHRRTSRTSAEQRRCGRPARTAQIAVRTAIKRMRDRRAYRNQRGGPGGRPGPGRMPAARARVGLLRSARRSQGRHGPRAWARWCGRRGNGGRGDQNRTVANVPTRRKPTRS